MHASAGLEHMLNSSQLQSSVKVAELLQGQPPGFGHFRMPFSVVLSEYDALVFHQASFWPVVAQISGTAWLQFLSSKKPGEGNRAMRPGGAAAKV